MGRFIVLRELGAGSFGRVVLAFDAVAQRYCALKTIHRAHPRRARELREEFRLLLERQRDINHPNVVKLHALFEGAEGPPGAPSVFFAMEYVGVAPAEPPEGEDGRARELPFEDGRDIERWVDEGGPRHSAEWMRRVHEGLRQLHDGLTALHGAGLLHRDIKPSNLLVRDGGPRGATLKVVDFGLSIDPERLGAATSPAGTPLHVAPEVFDVPPRVSPAADWFSVGVVLFELLEARAPYALPEGVRAGSFRELCAALGPVKRDRRNLPVVTPHPALPDGLRALVRGLLDPDPARRAGAAEVRAYLDLLGSPARTPFVGRLAERSHLAAAFEHARRGRQVTVVIEGRAGIGKTALVREFLKGVRADARVFSGACSPYEQVSFRTFSRIVDQLAAHLEQHPRLDLLPARHAAEFARVFPALAHALGLRAPVARQHLIDEREVRRRAFDAFLGLVHRLADDETPVVLWIDDAQWGDADSLPLVKRLLEAPPPGTRRALLVILSTRPPEETSSAADDDPTAGCDARRLVLGALDPDDAMDLAGRLAPARVDDVVRAAQGSPLHIAHLSRLTHDDARAEARSGDASLDDVLRRRFERLDAGLQRALTCVAVVGRPIERALLPALLAQDAGAVEVQRRLDELLDRWFLLEDTAGAERAAVATPVARPRPEGAPDGEARRVEVAHELIQRVALASLAQDAPPRRALYRHVADVLLREAEPRDPHFHEDQSRLREGAGELDRAAEHSLRGAERATEALAFARAAQGYARAIALGGEAYQRADLHRSLGEALANAGRGTEAARAFESAANLAERERPGDPAAGDLRREAASHYLRSGAYERGVQTMRDALNAVGVAVPRSDRAAMVTALAWHLRSRLLRAPTRRADATTLRRLDTLWAATTGLAMVQPAQAMALAAIHLHDALAQGDDARMVQALGYRAVIEASVGGALFADRWQATLREAEGLAARRADPYDVAWVAGARGTSAWLRGRWGECLRDCEEAVAAFRHRCRGAAWEAATGDIYILSALALTGQFRALSRRLPEVLRDALEREDLYAANGCRVGQACLYWLARDDVDGAREAAREAARTASPDGFHMGHYHRVLAETQVELYAGRPRHAFDRVERDWEALGEQFLRLEYPRIELLHLRGRAALACLRGAPAEGPRGAWTAARFEAVASRSADEITRCRLPVAAPMAASLRASLAFARRRGGDAARALHEAEAGFTACEMALHATAAAQVRGALEGDAAALAGARRWMEDAGVRRPSALCAAQLPGFDEAHYSIRAAP